MIFPWSLIMTMALGADSTTRRKRSSARFLSVMSTMAASTNAPSSVEMGFSPISTGNSWPSLRRPKRSRPAPMERERGSAKKSQAVRRVGRAEALGDEKLDRALEELVPAVSEEALGLGIDEHDPSTVVDHDHGVRCRFDREPEALLGPFAAREVAGNGRKARELSAAVAERRRDAVRPNGGAVLSDLPSFHFVTALGGSDVQRQLWHARCSRELSAKKAEKCCPRSSPSR